MSEFVFKLPDLGEGTVEAEIVQWYVQPGDEVVEGQTVAEVMTDKANVEVPAPVSGTVLRTSGEPGDLIAVGSELIAIDEAGTGAGGVSARPAPTPPAAASPDPAPPPAAAEAGVPEAAPVVAETPVTSAPAPAEQAQRQPETAAEAPVSTRRILTSPAIRKHAQEAGVDLQEVAGSGPNGRIMARDLQAFIEARAAHPRDQAAAKAGTGVTVTESKVIGVRRVIAERLAQSKREIPHFAYVEEVDVTELEALRRHLNELHGKTLSILPFVATALLRVLPDFPRCNAHFDAETGMLRQFCGVHLGIAAQTPDGLKVPVIRDAHDLSLWQLADAIAAAAQRARSGEARPVELGGSTITLTSLGKLGGIVSTPIINRPEVAIVGVNKVAQRPVVLDGAVQVRAMMNLSSSFDHRFVDGFDAAAMIQALKRKLEYPATLFIAAPR